MPFSINSSKDFIFIRHAETEANKLKIACGMLDSLLTQKGYSDAQELGARLNNKLTGKKIAIYHSPLKRSKNTAELIAEGLKLDFISEVKDLHEHSFGDWEGLEWCEVLKKLENNEVPPNGESRNKFRERKIAAINQILNDGENDELPIIVGHGGSVYAIASAYGYYPYEVKNCDTIMFKKVNETWKTYFFTKKNEWIEKSIFVKNG